MTVRTGRPGALIPALLAASMLLTACGTVGVGGSHKEMIVGMSDDILATDPASGYDPGSWLLFNNVFQSLLTFRPGSSTPTPDAARRCAFSGGGRTYTCTLREGLTFSNGDALTSADVKFSFDRAIRIDDPAGPGPLLSTVSRITTPDEKTVVLHLTVPDATFPSKIASGAGSIVDRHVYPANELLSGGKAIGSGPYKIDSLTKAKAVFSVRSHYRGTADVKNAGVVLDLFHGDQHALESSLKKGDLDVAYRGLTANAITALENTPTSRNGGIDVVQGTSAEIQHLVFNLDDPVVGNIAVRKAVAYLVNRDALVERVYRSTAIPLYSIIPAGITGHSTSFFDLYGGGPQPDKARTTLRNAGITHKVKLTLWSTPIRYGPSTDDELRTIAEQLNDSGLFDATMKSVPFDRYEKGISAGRYGVYVKGWVPDYPDPDNFTQPFLGKDNVLSNHYTNRRITDRIIPRTASMTNRSDTREPFTELQDTVAQQVPILPLWQGRQYAVARDDVIGLQNCLDTSTIFRFWELAHGYPDHN